MAADAESIAEARLPGGAKDRAVTAASVVDPAGAKVCWCGMCGAAKAATGVLPTGAWYVGVGETSRQKSVDVEQLCSVWRSSFAKMGQERQERTLHFFSKKELRKRCEVLPSSSSGKLVEG